jgi:prepilin-type processing-associated H-X9-DG protein
MSDSDMMTDNPDDAPGCARRAPSRWRGWLGWLAVAVVVGFILLALVAPMARRGVPEVARRVACQQNIKAIALAMLAYEREHGSLPPACTRDAEGRPLHSWRTLLLPYLEEQPLFDSIDLTKPWDDPANAAARERMPPVFACPSASLPPGHTTYLVIVSPQGCFRAEGAVELAAVRQPSKTLLLAEFPTARATPWMAPMDADESMFLALESGNLPDHRNGVVNCGFADGHGVAINLTDPTDPPAQWRRSLIGVQSEKLSLGE